jgi:hypothetical protein
MGDWGMKKVSVLTVCLIAVFIMTMVLNAGIKQATAASSSLPEGARLGSGMGFGYPFMGMGGFYGSQFEDMDDIDMGFGGMMGPYGAMNPWMMQGMGQSGGY